jgi:putative lipoprotein
VRHALAAAILVSAVFHANVVAAETAPDRWFGEDKLLHFGASCGIAYTVELWTQPFVEGAVAPLVVGGAVSLGAGVLKELYDRSLGRPISARDLVWDALGVVTGLALGWLVLELFGERPSASSSSASSSASRNAR